MDEEKTEQPTPRTRQRARERGVVPRSRELTGTLVLLIGFIVVFLLMKIWSKLALSMFEEVLGHLSDVPITGSNSQGLLRYSIEILLAFMWPLFMAVALTAILISLIQTRGALSLEQIRPRLENISPLRGLRRMFSRRGFAELIKAVMKIVIVSLVAWIYLRANMNTILQALTYDPRGYLLFFGGHAFKLGIWIIAVLLFLALLDYAYEVYLHEKDLMMTRMQAREEYKQTEGDPLVRMRIRSRQRQIAMTRMLREVPRADVVITNPIQIAVALRYETDMPAPQVVAKGKGAIAERIIALAKEFGVHIHRDPPLARALYQTVEVGGIVPYEFYVALAEILAYVYRTKKKYRGRASKIMAG